MSQEQLTEEPADDHDAPQKDLTPLRAHYLKKSLIQLQFTNELDALASTDIPGLSNLSLLGPPFSPVPKSLVSTLPPGLDVPFLKYIFRQFVVTFPFMNGAPKNFFAVKVQPFVDAMVARNIASSSSILDEDGSRERATRRKLVAKIERNMALLVGSATKLVEQEEVVRLSQNDLDRLERLAQKRQKRMAKNKDYFEVNVVGVRTVVNKGRMRSRAHEEFIIRTRRARYHDVYVSRRYGDFRTLANELAKRYPEENIRPPPAKDRSYVTAPSSPQPNTATFSEQLYDAAAGAAGSLGSAASYLSGWETTESPGSPAPSVSPNPSRLAREKNRLTLRSYLNSLLRSYTIASSPVLKSFLLQGFIELTPSELEDAKKREEADKVREDGRKRFAREIAGRVEGLRDAVKSVKGDIMGKDGLTHVFGTIKVTPNIRDLPDNYQGVVEWARISLASTVFHTFVASDDASETFAGLKRIHGLMPYLLLKGALKITNPIAMIRSVLDLFLAQPFGGRSLLQRMFTSSLTEEVRVLEQEIDLVKDKVDDAIICEKIRQFVYAPREIQATFKADAVEEKMNIVVVILRSAEEPMLSRAQANRLAKANRSHREWEKSKKARRASEGRTESDESDDDEEPPDEDAWFIEDLRVLTGLYQRLRDKEQLIALLFEGFTSELLKDIITIFYSPLAQVYRAASIADSLSDFQNFINDLIKTVEQVEELSQTDPHLTVQAFISLVQRHESSFYNFVHKVHSKGEGLFDSLMRWIELFITVVREGLGESISLEFLLPHTGKERQEILEEVDKVALYHYKLKVIYEDKLRRRFGRVQGAGGGGAKNGTGVAVDADAEDEAAKALVDGVIGEISFGDLVKGDALDLAAEETDEEDSDSDEGSSESGSEASGSSSEYETGSEETTTEEDARPLKGKDKSLPELPPQAGNSHLPPPRKHTHVRSGSSASVVKPPPPTPPPGRKRSLSLKRSMTHLLGGGKKDKEVPPLPALPTSVLNQPGGPTRSSGSGRPSPVPSPSPSSTSFAHRASTSSRPASSSSMRRPDGVGSGVEKPVLQVSVVNPSNQYVQVESGSGSPVLASPVAVRSPGMKPSTPSPLAGLNNVPDAPSSSNAPAPAPSTEKVENARKPKKKDQAVGPPELKHIPLLLPVFVEMMRPSLIPRKRTLPVN